MAYTLIASIKGGTDTSGTTLDTTAGGTSGALNVAAGDVLVAWTKHEGASTTIAVAETAGGNSFTFDAGDKVSHSNGDLHASFGYVLSASADSSFTGRMTLGASRGFRSLIIWQFRPDSGETVTKDTSNTGQGNGTAAASGAITTTGTDEVVAGGHGEYSPAVASNVQINGVAADGQVHVNDISGNLTSSWYRILAATFAGGTASGTVSSGDWICNVIAFKSEAAAGGGASARSRFLPALGVA